MSKSLASVTFMAPVQALIPQVEERMRVQANAQNPDLEAALDHLLASGGKRVRPAVALLSGGMLGSDQERTITLAAAIELLHTATLVHDDLIDGALLRRGIATLNAQWSPAATVLTGDFIFARAAMLAAETESTSVMHLFAETLVTIVNGELTQLFTSRGVASREDYFNRIYAKTASMFELATRAPALLSQAGETVAERMRQYGHNIGMAFQIVDDILDFTGEQITVGKPVASDLRQGLFTLPALYYLERNPGDPDMKTITSGGSLTEAVMDKLVARIRESGAIEASMEEAQQYIERGLAILPEMPASPERDGLEALAEYITRREL